MTIRITFKLPIYAHTFCADLYEHCGLVCTRRGKNVTMTIESLTQCEAVLSAISAHITEIFDREFNNR